MSSSKLYQVNERSPNKSVLNSDSTEQAHDNNTETLNANLLTTHKDVYPITPFNYQISVKYPDKGEDDKVDWLHRAADRIPCFGILLSLMASILIGTAGLLVKVTQSVHGVQVSVFRAIIQAAIYLIILMCRGIKPKASPGEFWAVFGRAFFCSCSITGAYFAIKLIPLGDSTIIKLSLPIWVLVISYFVLGEACSFNKISAVTVSLTGVALVAKPEECLRLLNMIEDAFNITNAIDYDPNYIPTNQSFALNAQAGEDSPLDVEQVVDLTGTYSNLVLGRLLALISSICLALSIICLRMCKSTPVEVIIFWLSLIAVTSGSGLLLALGEWRMPDNWNDVGLILLNGMFGALGQWFLSSSLKVEQSGVISLVRTFDIIVAFFYSATLLHENIPTTSIVGAILVSYGTFAVAVPKLFESRRASKSANGS